MPQPKDNEAPLTDEEIEATYFPGSAVLAPSTVVFDFQSLRYDGERQWFVEGTGGVEFTVAGNEAGPESKSVESARYAVDHFDTVRTAAVQLANSFMKETGSWSLDALSTGTDAKSHGCDVVVKLSFSPSDGSDSYGYTEFSACLVRTSMAGALRFHAQKLVIEFV